MTKGEMPIEKAIMMLEYIKHVGNGDGEYKNDAQEIAINMGIRALKQMDAFDKLVAEINNIEYLSCQEPYVVLKGVLDIIDQYRK